MILSILICTIPGREDSLGWLCTEINRQIFMLGAFNSVEYLIDNRTKVTTGEKRNDLLTRARGEYTMFVDDDDMIMDESIKNIISASSEKPDCMAINGIMTTNGSNLKKWWIALNNPFIETAEGYLRFPNHITPIKREHAIKIKFPNKSNFEDYEWACALKESGLLKTEVKIETPIYHYRYSTQNKSYV